MIIYNTATVILLLFFTVIFYKKIQSNGKLFTIFEASIIVYCFANLYFFVCLNLIAFCLSLFSFKFFLFANLRNHYAFQKKQTEITHTHTHTHARHKKNQTNIFYYVFYSVAFGHKLQQALSITCLWPSIRNLVFSYEAGLGVANFGRL